MNEAYEEFKKIILFFLNEERLLQSGDRIKVIESLFTSTITQDSVELKPDDILNVIENRNGSLCVMKLESDWDRHREIHQDQLHKILLVHTVTPTILFFHAKLLKMCKFFLQ